MDQAGNKVSGARKLLGSKKIGILSTHAADLKGYPFGSAVTYTLDASGSPVLFLSALAQHSKNLAADARCSLAVFGETSGKDIQDMPRLTWVGECRRVVDVSAELKEGYFEVFPEAREYEKLDFSFYRIDLLKIRWIGGFGQAGWIEPAEYLSVAR